MWQEASVCCGVEVKRTWQVPETYTIVVVRRRHLPASLGAGTTQPTASTSIAAIVAVTDQREFVVSN
jgi:hypothetical protein